MTGWTERAAGLTLAAALAHGLAGGIQLAQGQTLRYPVTKKGEVVDEYHGIRVADPYRWLEALNSAETRGWIHAQNELTEGYLASLPGRETLRRRITELWDFPKVSIPEREGGRLFYRKNSGL